MKPAPLVLAVALLCGCAGTNKEVIGTVIGGYAGAKIGKKVGGSDGEKVGAVLGAVVGNRIGAYLDEEDRKRLAALEQKALATGTGGEFTANKSKAKVTVAVSKPTLEKPREYGMSGTAKPQPLVLIDPISIRAYVDTPIYNNTSEAESPKLVVQRGVPLSVSAKVANENWMVAGDDRVGLGYVPKRYLEAGAVSEPTNMPTQTPAPGPDKPGKTAKAEPKKPVSKPQPAKPGPSDSSKPMTKEQYEEEMARLYAAYKPRSNDRPDAQAPGATRTATSGKQPSVMTAQVSSECKVITRRVTPPAGGGDPFSEDIKYCNEPPKGWQTQTA